MDRILSNFYPTFVPSLPHFQITVDSKIFEFRSIAPRASLFYPLLISGVEELPQQVLRVNFLNLSQNFAKLFWTRTYMVQGELSWQTGVCVYSTHLQRYMTVTRYSTQRVKVQFLSAYQETILNLENMK